MENEINQQELEQHEIEAALNPSVVNVMTELKQHFNLPIEIVIVQNIQGLVSVKLKVVGMDEYVLGRFINMANNLEILKNGGTFIEEETL